MGLLSLLFGCKSEPPPFEKTNGVWHYRKEPILDADADSFQPLSDHYAKDRTRVYYADTYRSSQEYFLKRHVRVVVIDGADAASFAYVDLGYARDRRTMYYDGVRFDVKDLATFTLLKDGYAKDRLTGYYHQWPVTGSDGATFEPVGYHYSRDAANAFYSWLEPGTNGGPPTRHTRRLAGAAPASLTSFEFGYAADSSQTYYEGKPLTRDPSSFRVLSFGYAVGKDAVFHEGVPIAGADPATFAMLEAPTDSADARDARAMYQQGKRTQQRP
jgi:hypothetical protein